jgi:hypothetical protein
MRPLRAALAGAAALVLVGTAAAPVTAQQEPPELEVATGPEFAWVTYVTESNPRPAPGPVPSAGDGPGYTWLRNASYAYDLESSDPRISGTLTGTFSDDCLGDPDLTCVGWNTEEITGPDGSWTGWVWMTHRPEDLEDPMAESMMTLMKVFSGHGAYDGLTLILFGEGPFGGKADFHGLIYEGAPPPPLNELTFPEPSVEMAAGEEAAVEESAEGAPEEAAAEPVPASTPAGDEIAWHRLNPDGPEHERLVCSETEGTVSCLLDKVEEVDFIWDAGTARFSGEDVTASWQCPAWYPAPVCDGLVSAWVGTTRYQPVEGEAADAPQELVITDVDGQAQLWVQFVDWALACPWYGTFEEAMAANPDGGMDCAFEQ